METIFDYAPTQEEIEECGFLNGFRILWLHLDTSDPVTPASYFTTVTPELALFDLYLLFRERKDTFRMANYASQIPDLVQQYELGFDNLIIPV